MPSLNIKYSKAVIYIISVVVLSTLILKNGIYWAICFSVLFFIIKKLWRPYFPAIFVVCMVYQWLQVFATVAFATFLDQPVNFRTPHNGIAIIWGLLGLMLITIVISQMLKRFKGSSFEEMKYAAQFISPQKVLLIYIIFAFLGVSIHIFSFEGLSQIFYAFFQLKWVFFMLYAYLMLLGYANKRLFIAVFLFEFVSGLYSYFSYFKDPAIYFSIV